jgi:hypothetical protein
VAADLRRQRLTVDIDGRSGVVDALTEAVGVAGAVPPAAERRCNADIGVGGNDKEGAEKRGMDSHG